MKCQWPNSLEIALRCVIKIQLCGVRPWDRDGESSCQRLHRGAYQWHFEMSHQLQTERIDIKGNWTLNAMQTKWQLLMSSSIWITTASCTKPYIYIYYIYIHIYITHVNFEVDTDNVSITFFVWKYIRLLLTRVYKYLSNLVQVGIVYDVCASSVFRFVLFLAEWLYKNWLPPKICL